MVFESIIRVILLGSTFRINAMCDTHVSSGAPEVDIPLCSLR